MKKEQLSEHIGNIDDRLVQQAEHIPNYARQHRQKGFKRFTAIAAVIALMVCSFTVGAVAFAKEIVVEVPVEQETIELKEIGLTLILPDNWKDKYALEYDADFKEYYIYNPDIREAMGLLYREEGILAEGSAAISVGALLQEGPERFGENVAMVISGGNIDKNVLESIAGGS